MEKQEKKCYRLRKITSNVVDRDEANTFIRDLNIQKRRSSHRAQTFKQVFL